MESGCKVTVAIVKSKIALSLSTLNHPCCIHGDAVAALPSCQTICGDFFCFSTTCFFILVLAEAVDPVEAEFFIREAQVSNAWLGSSTARAGVDYGVTDAAILQPASFTAVQKLKLPCSIQLTHFGHHWAISNASLHRLRIIHLLKAFEEIHFAWRGCRGKGKERIFVVRTCEKVKVNRACTLFRRAKRSPRNKPSPEGRYSQFSWQLCLIVFRIFQQPSGQLLKIERQYSVNWQHSNLKLLLKRFHFHFDLTSGELPGSIKNKLVSWLAELFELSWIRR